MRAHLASQKAEKAKQHLKTQKEEEQEELTISRDEAWSIYHDTTAKLSDICRTLNFAGVAIVWIFVERSSNQITISDYLLFALLFLVSSLFFDILQYLYKSFLYSILARSMEYNHKKEKEHHGYYNSPTNIFFLMKVFSTGSGYICLAIFIYSRLKIV